MDILNSIFGLLDKIKSFPLKILFAIFIIAGGLFINDLWGLSFNYSTSSKLELLKDVAELKKVYKTNPKVLLKLQETENTILERKTYLESFANLFSKEDLEGDKRSYLMMDSIWNDSLVWNDSINWDNKEKIKTIIDSSDQLSNKKKRNERSQLYHTITSSWGFIIVLLTLPFTLFTRTVDAGLIFGVIVMGVITIGMITLCQYALGLIPVILNSPWINYILNFIIHGLIWWLFFKTISASKRIKSSRNL
ncbi:hypothetical protein [Ekhidna sp.]|uniref:hypothetical protein n=1 Tax=Ekhidna sp. TaxID=2608089 RepID=UPI0032EC93D0